MNIYLTENECRCLRDVCNQWIDLMEDNDEDLVTPMLDEGLGSALYKLFKNRKGEILYKKYAKKKGGAE